MVKVWIEELMVEDMYRAPFERITWSNGWLAMAEHIVDIRK